MKEYNTYERYIKKKKKKLDGNAKNVHLYPTAKGQELANLHREFDLNETRKFAEYIVQQCSLQDLETFHSVMKVIQEFYEHEAK